MSAVNLYTYAQDLRADCELLEPVTGSRFRVLYLQPDCAIVTHINPGRRPPLVDWLERQAGRVYKVDPRAIKKAGSGYILNYGEK